MCFFNYVISLFQFDFQINKWRSQNYNAADTLLAPTKNTHKKCENYVNSTEIHNSKISKLQFQQKISNLFQI